MNYHNITHVDMLNGADVGVVLWLAGCEHNCLNCQNPETHDKMGGIPFDDEAKKELFEALDHDYIKRITFSGGDPLATYNRDEVLKLAWEIIFKFPNKDIWIYTGYKWEEVKDIPRIFAIDVLVDGKYIEALNTPSPKWCGSSNQRIIDIHESENQGKIVLYKED